MEGIKKVQKSVTGMGEFRKKFDAGLQKIEAKFGGTTYDTLKRFPKGVPIFERKMP